MLNKIFKPVVLVLLLLTVNVFPAGKDKPQKCIMVFGAHADDVEEMFGGTFAKYISEGYQGVYVCVMNNLSGSQITKVPGNWNFFEGKSNLSLISSPKMYQVGALESHQQRTEEATNAAKVYGAVPVFLNFGEPELWLGRKLVVFGTKEFLQYDPPGRMQISLATRYSKEVDVVVDLLKKYKPEITIIHTLGGEKLDHRESAYIVYLAFKKAISRGIPVGKLWMVIRGWLLDPPAQESGRGKPDVKIDIRKYIDIKNKAWNQHISQNNGDVKKYFLPRHPEYNINMEEFITVLDNTK